MMGLRPLNAAPGWGSLCTFGGPTQSAYNGMYSTTDTGMLCSAARRVTPLAESCDLELGPSPDYSHQPGWKIGSLTPKQFNQLVKQPLGTCIMPMHEFYARHSHGSSTWQDALPPGTTFTSSSQLPPVPVLILRGGMLHYVGMPGSGRFLLANGAPGDLANGAFFSLQRSQAQLIEYSNVYSLGFCENMKDAFFVAAGGGEHSHQGIVKSACRYFLRVVSEPEIYKLQKNFVEWHTRESAMAARSHQRLPAHRDVDACPDVMVGSAALLAAVTQDDDLLAAVEAARAANPQVRCCWHTDKQAACMPCMPRVSPVCMTCLACMHTALCCDCTKAMQHGAIPVHAGC